MNFAILEPQLKSVIEKLRETQAELFKVENENINISSILQHKLTLEEFDFMRTNFSSIMNKTAKDTDNGLDDALEEINNIDILELVVAVDTSVDVDIRLKNILDTKISTPICVRITTDRSLVAGSKLEFHGKIADYSIKKRLIEIFEEQAKDLAVV